MERLFSREEAWRALAQVRREGATIGFVPTMGALHEGHLSLVRASCARTGVTAVSIFVNPTQFSADEDLEAYPRDLDRDLELLEAEGVEFVFTPSAREMYGDSASVTVDPGRIASRWEGEARPHHFGGVATVVTKLVNIIWPDVAFFGEKDYQQLKVVEVLADELDMPVVVVGLPTVREADGLAMSSRNAYLTREQREQARAISESLGRACEAVAWGETDASAIEMTMAQHLDQPLLTTEYAVVVDAQDLEPIELIDRPARALIAARVGGTRLIDNAALVPPRESRG
jgi:pantoate--beta-alanine ligase